MIADVDVVVVTFNNLGDLSPSISAAREWPRVRRVVVVDNGSGDGTADLAERLADVVVRMPSNVGFGAAQNRGRLETQAPFLLLLNPDALVVPASLEAGRRLLDARPDVAAVEGAVRRAADGAEERWQGPEPGLADLVARLFDLRRRLGEERLKRLAARVGAGYFSDRRVRTVQEVDFLAAVAPLVRRDAMDMVGGFDEGFFLYAEDVDLCHRLRRAGWRLVALPDHWATHEGGASSRGDDARRKRLWWESHRLLVHRHWAGPRRWLGAAVAAIGVASAARSPRARVVRARA